MDDSRSTTLMVMAALLALCLVTASLIFGGCVRQGKMPTPALDSLPDAGIVIDASPPMTVGYNIYLAP